MRLAWYLLFMLLCGAVAGCGDSNSVEQPEGGVPGTYSLQQTGTTTEGKLVITGSSWTEYIKDGDYISTTQGTYKYYPAQNSGHGQVVINTGDQLIVADINSNAGTMRVAYQTVRGFLYREWSKNSEKTDDLVIPDVPPITSLWALSPSSAEQGGSSIAVSLNWNINIQQQAAITLYAAASDESGTVIAQGEWSLPSGVGQFSNSLPIELMIPTDKPGTFNVELWAVDSRGLKSTPNSQHFTVSAATTPPLSDPPSGSVVRTIPFPAGITFVGDMAYDPATNSLIALTGDRATLSTWQRINLETGKAAQLGVNGITWVNHGSEVAFDGQFIWATTYGWANGVPQSYIYKLDMSGNEVSRFPCPVSSTGGFCEGLAWDGQYLWSAASDNKNLVKFTITGQQVAVFTNFFSSIGLNTDLAFDGALNRIISVRDGVVHYINPADGADAPVPIGNGISTLWGAWDGSLLWRPNFMTLEIEGYALPLLNK